MKINLSQMLSGLINIYFDQTEIPVLVKDKTPYYSIIEFNQPRIVNLYDKYGKKGSIITNKINVDEYYKYSSLINYGIATVFVISIMSYTLYK